MHRRGAPSWFLVGLVGLATASCGGKNGDGGDGVVTTDHCVYEPVPSTAGAGGTVAAGPLMAGAAEAVLDVPVSTALGAYTARAGFLGSSSAVDLREVPISGAFLNSIGVHTAPRVKALALSAGGETVVLIKLDLGLVYEGMVFDLETRLGADFHGKVILAASHSHSAWAQQTASSIYKVGLGEFRDLVYRRYLDALEETTLAALAARRPARIGVHADFSWDPGDQITRDRRRENDELMGGPRKDDSFFLIRVDDSDGVPIAVLPIYGVHGTLMGHDNSFASTDAPGAAERWLEEQFDHEVVVMHLQGAGADVSPTPHGRLNCALRPGNDGDPCFDWLRAEAHGLVALPALLEAFEAAGADMNSEIELEMLTRSVVLGPDPETFTIRDGALAYAPFERDRVADGQVFAADGTVLSPIDEFNAPVGAALCETDREPIFPAGEMPGTSGIAPYGSCVRVEVASEILGVLLRLDFETDENRPVCQTTRTTVSALRLGDLIVGTIPGELSVMLADRIRTQSPVAPDRTVLLGYAQGHIGYCMQVEDWLHAGYESSINVWGPLEAEYVSERLVELFTLVTTPEREDAAAGGADRVATPIVVDDLPIDDPAPMAGTIPAEVPDRVWLRVGPAASAQPAATLPRVSGHATFVFIGDDPHVRTPVVTLESETADGSGVFAPVRRRSGRVVREGDLLLKYTPLPLRREGEPQTHYWAVEWQAVPWIGAHDGEAALDSLDAVAGVPTGRYRFQVEGNGWDLASEPFEVIPAELSVTATRTGDAIGAAVTLHAEKSYRLLHMTLASNEPVPAGPGPVTVELLLSSGGSQIHQDVALDAGGNLAVSAGAEAEEVTVVIVTDRFGNTGTANL